MSQSVITKAVDRVRSWIAGSELPKAEIAAKADVDEKTVRQATGDDWNPTVNTLRKLERIVPPDWGVDHPARDSRRSRRKAAA